MGTQSNGYMHINVHIHVHVYTNTHTYKENEKMDHKHITAGEYKILLIYPKLVFWKILTGLLI